MLKREQTFSWHWNEFRSQNHQYKNDDLSCLDKYGILGFNLDSSTSTGFRVTMTRTESLLTTAKVQLWLGEKYEMWLIHADENLFTPSDFSIHASNMMEKIAISSSQNQKDIRSVTIISYLTCCCWLSCIPLHYFWWQWQLLDVHQIYKDIGSNEGKDTSSIWLQKSDENDGVKVCCILQNQWKTAVMADNWQLVARE